MVKYYRIHDSKEELFVTIDDSGAVIIKDKAGRKVFLSKYQAGLMKYGIENLLKGQIKDSGEEVHVEEIKSES